MTKQYLKDNNIEFEFVDVDMTEPEEKEQIRKEIQSKGGSLNYPQHKRNKVIWIPQRPIQGGTPT
jgi:glutaredoxin